MGYVAPIQFERKLASCQDLGSLRLFGSCTTLGRFRCFQYLNSNVPCRSPSLMTVFLYHPQPESRFLTCVYVRGKRLPR